MKEAKIHQIKNQLSRYLGFVRNGEIVRILDRDRPIAQIVPISTRVSSKPVGEEALAEMARKGLIRRGSEAIDREILQGDPPGRSSRVLEALLEERDIR